MEINQEWIDQQRALCEAATRGPWKSSDVRLDGMPVVFCENRRIFDAVVKDGQSAVDADFIASARTALPAALDALEAAYAEIASLKAEVRAAKDVTQTASDECSEGCNTITQLQSEKWELQEEVARLTAERDAAVKDMWLMRTCQNCKYKPVDYPSIHGACKGCDDEDKWKWRGLCAENAQEGNP